MYSLLLFGPLKLGILFSGMGPYTKRNTDKLERVQRRATKFILKSDDPYDIRLMKLNLMSLGKRRSLTDVTFLYKVLNGNIDIDRHQ